MKNKILLIGPLPPLVGGITTVFLTLARSNIFKLKFKAIVLDNNIASFTGNRKLWHFLYTLIKTVVMLIREKPDIVHAQIAQSSYVKDTVYLLISKLFGKKTIAHFHARPDLFDALTNIKQKYILGSSKFIDVMVVLTPYTRNLFEQRGWKSMIMDIPNVVHLPDYEIAEKNSGDLIVCQIGRLSLEKGLFTIIEVAQILQNFPIKFRLAGPFNKKVEKEEFFEKTSDLNNIEWSGVVAGLEKIKFLVNSAYFLLPTIHSGEVFPVAIVEAGAANLTVLTSSVGSIPEIIKDGENGLFIDMQQPEKIAEKILWLNEHPDKAKKIADSFHQDVVNKYSTGRLDQALLYLYSTLLRELE